MDLLGIEKLFSRAFDLVLNPGHTNFEKIIELDKASKKILVELKTTKKKLENNPKGFSLGLLKMNLILQRNSKTSSDFVLCLYTQSPKGINF